MESVCVTRSQVWKYHQLERMAAPGKRLLSTVPSVSKSIWFLPVMLSRRGKKRFQKAHIWFLRPLWIFTLSLLSPRCFCSLLVNWGQRFWYSTGPSWFTLGFLEGNRWEKQNENWLVSTLAASLPKQRHARLTILNKTEQKIPIFDHYVITYMCMILKEPEIRWPEEDYS